jgi:hypothetical protein
MELGERTQSILADYAAKLEALGSPDAIALHLQGLEVQAYCGNSHRCALAVDLANTLKAHGITPRYVDVGITFSATLRTPAGLVTIAEKVRQNADGFISRFDDGWYRDLIHPDDYLGLSKARDYDGKY